MSAGSSMHNKEIKVKIANIQIKKILYATDLSETSVHAYDILIKNGVPAETIVETAKEQNCDLIVMGTHGHGAITDVLIGSTAKWVVRQSLIPVLVIRLPKTLS
jgi:nucleotide-binding universal stress UspA family protein